MANLIPIPENIRLLNPYHPGKPIDEVKRELGLTDVVKLASNENPLGPSPRALEAARNAAANVALYPDGAAPNLRSAVSEHLQMPPETLVFGNGSDEVLHLLASSFLEPGDEVVQGDPSFAMYEIYVRQARAVPIKVPLTRYTHDLPAMADAVTSRTRMIFIANPNNPTGTLVGRREIESFLAQIPQDVLAVFDEAYDEYVDNDDKEDLRPLIRDGANIVVLRTFSKAYGLAGMRVGYAVAPPAIADILNRVRSPFNVNSIAQSAAAAALGDREHIRRSVALNAAGREYFYQEFQRMGLEYVPSQGNFVLVDVRRDSRAVFEALLRRGVIIRAGAGLGLPEHIRVTVGTMEQNQRFIAELERVLEGD